MEHRNTTTTTNINNIFLMVTCTWLFGQGGSRGENEILEEIQLIIIVFVRNKLSLTQILKAIKPSF